MDKDRNNTAIKVGVVDDQQLVRQGIVSLLSLSDKVCVIWQAEDGEHALKHLGANPVDVLLTDIRMPNIDGINLLKAIREQGSALPVVMLTTFDEAELFMASITSGANGFLLKDVSLDKLISTIETVAQGGYLIEPQVLTQIGQVAPQDSESLTVKLSQREVEILHLMAAGFANKEIANNIFLAEGTVKNHISNILTKLNARDRTQAVIKALQLAII